LSKRIDKTWVVLDSLENADANRCVDLFRRPDGTYGFEEFRRDVEDQGDWTPVQYFSSQAFSSMESARAAANAAVPWLQQ
jgi:hypothetical protein